MVTSMKDLKIGDRVRVRGDRTGGIGTVESVGDNFAWVRRDPESPCSSGWWTADRLTLLDERDQPREGPHEFTIRSPYKVGDRVLTSRRGSGTVVALVFHILPGDRLTRHANVSLDHGYTTEESVESLTRETKPSVAKPAEFRLMDRVTRRDPVGGRVGMIHSLYLDADEVPRAGVVWEGGHSAVETLPLADLRHAL